MAAAWEGHSNERWAPGDGSEGWPGGDKLVVEENIQEPVKGEKVEFIRFTSPLTHLPKGQ